LVPVVVGITLVRLAGNDAGVAGTLFVTGAVVVETPPANLEWQKFAKADSAEVEQRVVRRLPCGVCLVMVDAIKAELEALVARVRHMGHQRPTMRIVSAAREALLAAGRVPTQLGRSLAHLDVRRPLLGRNVNGVLRWRADGDRVGETLHLLGDTLRTWRVPRRPIV